MINNVKNLIENKLALIDYQIKQDGKFIPNMRSHELNGMKQVLFQMGFHLELDINPYYHENGQPSTYKISLLDI